MSGILDSKTRIIDTVITQEGKRQIANGGLRAVYATVSDKSSYYEYDALSGSSDATQRVYFEAPAESINDSIIMETDDSGKLLGYPTQGSTFFNDDGTISERTVLGDTTVFTHTADAAAFASLADGVISSAIDRFKNLYSIGTRDNGEPEGLQMEISPKSYSFTVNNNFPFPDGTPTAISNVDYIEPLFFDELLANTDNFKFLPPLTEKLSESERDSGSVPSSKMFGKYTKFQKPEPMTYQGILNHLNKSSENSVITGDPDATEDSSSSGTTEAGYDGTSAGGEAGGNSGLAQSEVDGSSVNLSSDLLPRERFSVFFTKTSSTNNIFMQMFEVDSSSSKLKKLDVIHYGTFNVSGDSRNIKNVFFVGKIFINSIGLPAFVSLFTIIMD